MFVFISVFFLGLLQADLCAHRLVVYSYRIYEDDIVEPGMLGSTAINRCVALSEFDVSDAHITNHSSSSTTTAATAAAGTATSSEHLPSDQSSVVYSVDVFNASVVVFVAVVDHQKEHQLALHIPEIYGLCYDFQMSP